MSGAQVVWLVTALQLLLFAAVWQVAAGNATGRRLALRELARFDAVLALALLLIAGRGPLPYWLTHALADMLVLGAMLLLWRGIQQALRLPPMASPLPLVAMALGAIAVLGLDAESAPWRGAVLLLVMAWMVGRLSLACLRPVLTSLGPAAGRAIWALASGLAALMLARAVGGLWLDWPMEAHLGDASTLALGLLSTAVLTLLNALLASLLLRGTLGRLRSQAQIDGLTGLVNDQGLARALAQAWSRWSREHRRFAVLTLVIEPLPALRAQSGPAVADDVLRRAAAVVSHELRQTDVLARGADGALVAVLDGQLSTTDLDVVVRRLQESVEAMRLLPLLPALRLHLRVGSALVAPGDSQAQTVTERALNALRGSPAGAVVQSAAC
ncbi:GGDEF domain-containing protein [Ideonella sp. 4Y11]|uniref:GGDEF domain-containing protein n=1 Tax=Ideonella aquatica TaxID=2824119 RepID=A0A940YJZ7_9BURK|nr:GGDEF domain-containing protein [Ideonella aquatica]MBQ0961505.1 GGDEF domain-containing protein [Ideonella aquatica]